MKTQIVGVGPIKNNRFTVNVIERRWLVFTECRTVNVSLYTDPYTDDSVVVRAYYTDTFETFDSKDGGLLQNILDWLKAPIV